MCDVFWEVLREERDRVAGGVGNTGREGNGDVADILPVRFGGDTGVLGNSAEEGAGAGDMDMRCDISRSCSSHL